MNFVKLTMPAGTHAFVNLDMVCELFPQSSGVTTVVYSGDVTTQVRETPEQIINWIATGKLE